MLLHVDTLPPPPLADTNDVLEVVWDVTPLSLQRYGTSTSSSVSV
jgi:hypothetical protein